MESKPQDWIDDLDIPAPTDDDMPFWGDEPNNGEGFEALDTAFEALSAAPKAAFEAPVSISPERVDRCLREQFGLPSFREGQREVIETALAGRSALAVMPTGAGKSLCYQLPGLLLPGITIVISPLIALMKDQVDSMLNRGLSATFINSTLGWPEQRERLERMVRGQVKLVFVAPERFRSEAFKSALRHSRVSLFVIDEAHCISEWGHDFRPDYLALGQARKDMGCPVTLAMTATATPKVRADIVKMLDMPEADVFVSGFERPNLFLEVYKARGKKDKLGRMEALIRHMGGTSIVYCATRKAVEEIAEQLRAARFRVGAYHGGMSDTGRDTVQDEFMRGDFDVLVATNAFGMGVDKADIRSIVHYQMPSSMEAYYQAAGRAGRDGGASHCLLLYNYADRHVPDFFINNSHPDRNIIEDTWAIVRRGNQRYDTKSIANKVRGKVSHMAISSSLRLLRRYGHIEYQAQEQSTIDLLDTSALRVDWRAMADRRRFEEEKLQKVIYYAAGNRCRTADILRYFGSRTSFEDRCGHCDNCIDVAPYASSAEARRPRLAPATPEKTEKKSRSSRTKKAASAPSAAPAGAAAARARDEALISSPEPTLTIVRKILACIARGRQSLSLTMIGRILTGSRQADVLRYNHDKNSTYGLLSDLTSKQITALLEDMLAEGFIVQDGFNVALTPIAVEVMKGEAALPAPLGARLDARFERATGDSVRQAMARVLGFGPASNEAAPAPPPSSPPAAGKPSRKPLSNTVATTLAMLIDGHTPQEISQSRELKNQTIVQHVIMGARAGATDGLDFSLYTDERVLSAVRATAPRIDWEAGLKDFRDAVSEAIGGRHISYDALRMNIAFLIHQGELQ